MPTSLFAFGLTLNDHGGLLKAAGQIARHILDRFLNSVEDLVTGLFLLGELFTDLSQKCFEEAGRLFLKSTESHSTLVRISADHLGKLVDRGVEVLQLSLMSFSLFGLLLLRGLGSTFESRLLGF